MITVPVPVPGGASQASHACVPTPRALAGESNCLWFIRFELGCVVSVLNLGALYHDLLCHPHHLLGYCLSCRSWNWQIVRENWTPTIAKFCLTYFLYYSTRWKKNFAITLFLLRQKTFKCIWIRSECTLKDQHNRQTVDRLMGSLSE